MTMGFGLSWIINDIWIIRICFYPTERANKSGKQRRLYQKQKLTKQNMFLTKIRIFGFNDKTF